MIGSFSVSPSSVVQGNSVTLTASNVTDADIAVAAVEFYRDSNGNGLIDPATDQLLGMGTRTTGTNNWTLSVSSATFPVGRSAT